MVYSAEGSKSVEPSAILTAKRLKTADGADTPRSIGYSSYAYYCSYADFNMQERWRYLDWLSRGRPATRAESHLLLFLSGLERRSIAEGQDIPFIWQELWRLYQTRSEELYTFRYQAKRLLWFLIPKSPEAITDEQVQFFAEGLHSLSPWTPEPQIKLSCLLWWCARRLAAVPCWMAYHSARVSLEASNTVVLTRASEEMKQLFALRFREMWGDSIPISLPPKARRRIEYEPFNRSLVKVTASWLDPFKLTSGWLRTEAELVAMYNQCQQDLRPLGLLLGKEGVTRRSVGAWEATPAVLRQGEHPSRRRLVELGGDSLQKTGFHGTSVGSIAKLLDLPERDSLTPTVSRRLTESIQNCGFKIEPDTRLTGKSYKWNDPVVLFVGPTGSTSLVELNGGSESEAAERYQICAFLLKLAFYVAQAAGSVPQSALTLIATTLSKEFNWNDLERKRFKALAGLVLWRGVEPSSIRAITGTSVFKYDIEVIKQLLLKLIATEKKIDRSQEEALRFAWKRLYLDPRTLNTEFDNLSLRGFIFVGQNVVPAKGEKIPPPPESHVADAPLRLDRAAIDALLEDTRHVQAALGAAMMEGGFIEPTPELETPVESLKSNDATLPVADVVESDTDFRGLTPRFSPFLRALLERDVWCEQEAKQLAQRHSVMLSGAIEAINDWAFEELGTLLIWEEHATLTLERTLLQQTG